jgi:hypothetical protein
MFKTVLVNELVIDGQHLIEALQQQHFPVTGAVWRHLPESLEWRLIIVSPAVDQVGPMAVYTKLQGVLTKINPSQLTLSDITVVSPQSEEFQNLQSLVSAPGRFSAGPVTGHPRNIIFEDNYVYQL